MTSPFFSGPNGEGVAEEGSTIKTKIIAHNMPYEISWKLHQIVSMEDCAYHCFKKEWLLIAWPGVQNSTVVVKI